MAYVCELGITETNSLLIDQVLPESSRALTWLRADCNKSKL